MVAQCVETNSVLGYLCRILCFFFNYGAYFKAFDLYDYLPSLKSKHTIEQVDKVN